MNGSAIILIVFWPFIHTKTIVLLQPSYILIGIISSSNDFFENGISCAYKLSSVFDSEILQVTNLSDKYTNPS